MVTCNLSLTLAWTQIFRHIQACYRHCFLQVRELWQFEYLKKICCIDFSLNLQLDHVYHVSFTQLDPLRCSPQIRLSCNFVIFNVLNSNVFACHQKMDDKTTEVSLLSCNIYFVLCCVDVYKSLLQIYKRVLHCRCHFCFCIFAAPFCYPVLTSVKHKTTIFQLNVFQ